VTCLIAKVHTKHDAYHTHTHTYIHIHTHIYTHVHTYTQYTHTKTHTHIHTRIHTHIDTYKYKQTHTYTYAYIHTHTHTYTHIHIYIHTHTVHTVQTVSKTGLPNQILKENYGDVLVNICFVLQYTKWGNKYPLLYVHMKDKNFVTQNSNDNRHISKRLASSFAE
jgi:hypothetical protein